MTENDYSEYSGFDPDFDGPPDRRLVLEHRISILEGLIAALDQWHEISRVIAASPSRSAAVLRLTVDEFSFSHEQADLILDTALSRLAGENRKAISDELDRFRAELRDSGWEQ